MTGSKSAVSGTTLKAAVSMVHKAEPGSVGVIISSHAEKEVNGESKKRTTSSSLGSGWSYSSSSQKTRSTSGTGTSHPHDISNTSNNIEIGIGRAAISNRDKRGDLEEGQSATAPLPTATDGGTTTKEYPVAVDNSIKMNDNEPGSSSTSTRMMGQSTKLKKSKRNLRSSSPQKVSNESESSKKLIRKQRSKKVKRIDSLKTNEVEDHTDAETERENESQLTKSTKKSTKNLPEANALACGPIKESPQQNVIVPERTNSELHCRRSDPVHNVNNDRDNEHDNGKSDDGDARKLYGWSRGRSRPWMSSTNVASQERPRSLSTKGLWRRHQSTREHRDTSSNTTNNNNNATDSENQSVVSGATNWTQFSFMSLLSRSKQTVMSWAKGRKTQAQKDQQPEGEIKLNQHQKQDEKLHQQRHKSQPQLASSHSYDSGAAHHATILKAPSVNDLQTATSAAKENKVDPLDCGKSVKRQESKVKPDREDAETKSLPEQFPSKDKNEEMIHKKKKAKSFKKRKSKKQILDKEQKNDPPVPQIVIPDQWEMTADLAKPADCEKARIKTSGSAKVDADKTKRSSSLSKQKLSEVAMKRKKRSQLTEMITTSWMGQEVELDPSRGEICGLKRMVSDLTLHGERRKDRHQQKSSSPADNCT